MDYKEQIKSPKWQRRRLEILQRDDFTCQICGCKDKMLHVHHTAYERDKMIWEYPDEMLITLCEDCHEHEHMLENVIPDSIWRLKRRGVTNHELHALIEFADYNSYRGNNDFFRNIIGDSSLPEIDNPYIKLLSDRRKSISNGTTKQNRS